MKNIFLIAILFVVTWAETMAVPAKPGLNTLTMSDGTTLNVQMLGDEWNHGLATADRLTIALGDDGFFYYVVSGEITDVRAHDVANRSASELLFVNANRDQMTMTALKEAKADKMRAVRPRGISLKETQIPNNGSPRVPIILVQYTDKSMSHTKAQFEAHYKTNAKSVFNYFKDQSNGLYTPQFDIYGIYTLPSSRATYGENNNRGIDKGVATMVADAINKAGNDIDWSLYDNDGNGEADVCIVVYAGVGESQASRTLPESIWPCQWSLSDAVGYSGDGPGAVERNGVIIDLFAVFNELDGSDDNGTTLDGIGTFCHEFSHCLGLPDFYDTTNRGYFGMSRWSLMAQGCYNDNGNTPIGYSAYEKNFMG